MTLRPLAWIPLHLAWIFALASTVACGGGGTSAGGPIVDPQDVTPPTAALRFPPPGSVTDAHQLTVTGTAADDRAVATVSVNGVDAYSSDGFATWRCAVELVVGRNDLVVRAEDRAGRVEEHAASTDVHRLSKLLVGPRRVAWDPVTSRALVLPSNGRGELRALWAVNPVGGEIAVVSDDDVGTGSAFLSPREVCVDATANRARVLLSK